MSAEYEILMLQAEVEQLNKKVAELEKDFVVLQTEHNKVLDILDGILMYLHGNPAEK